MFTPSHRTKATATRRHSSQYESLRPIKKRRLSRVVILCLVGALIIVAVFLAGKLGNQAKKSPTTADQATTASQPKGNITQGDPIFNALTPNGKNVTWSHLDSPNGDSFYVYTDTINGSSIRVTEQKLPAHLADKDQLSELAKSYNANRTITAGDITVYVGSTTKGQQSVLFTAQSLLIMITSDSILNDHQWTSYITSLQ